MPTSAPASPHVERLPAPGLIRWLWLAGLGGLLLSALPLLGASRSEARIAQLAGRIEGAKVLVSFRLVNGFDAKVLERVQSGLPTSFVFKLELVRKRRLWWDRHLAVSELQVAAMYNAVTREYLINFKQDGKLVDSRVVHDAADLQSAMTVIEKLELASTEVLPEEGRVRVRVQAELGSKTFFYFIPTDIDTDWQNSSLSAPPEP